MSTVRPERMLQRLSESPQIVYSILASAIGLALVLTLILPTTTATLMLFLLLIASSAFMSGTFRMQYLARRAAEQRCEVFEAVLTQAHVGVVFDAPHLANSAKTGEEKLPQIVGFQFESSTKKSLQTATEIHAYQAGFAGNANAAPVYHIIDKQDRTPIDEMILKHRHDDHEPIFIKISPYLIDAGNGSSITSVTILEEVSELITKKVWLTGLQQLASALAKAEALEQVSPILIETILGGRSFVVCSLYIADDEEQTLNLVSHHGLALPIKTLTISNKQEANSHNFIVEVYRHGEPIWIAHDDNLLQNFGSYAVSELVMEAHVLGDLVARDSGDIQLFDTGNFKQQSWGLKAACALPLLAEDHKIGVLAMALPIPFEFPEREREFALIVTEQCGQAIRRIQAEVKARESAALQERHRLARDLHDAVSQTLFSASLTAETLLIEFDQQPHDFRQRVERLAELTKGAFAEMRTLLMELRPEAILKAPMVELLQHLITTARVHKKVEGELLADNVTQVFPPKTQVALYRIAQEAINNILKHSQATLFRVELSQHGDTVRLCISDDGQGFDTAKSSAGLGLESIRERAEEIGATVNIESTPGEGTIITVICVLGEEK